MDNYYVYDANDTMKKLGRQCITEYVDAIKAIKDIINAYTTRCGEHSILYSIAVQSAYDMLLDIFVLGVMYGVRKERARRKNKKPRQCANIDRATAVKPTTI